MSDHSYDVETYNAALQSEVNKLWGIGIVLLIVLIAMVVYSIVLIISSYLGAKIGVKVNQSIQSNTVVMLLRTVMLIMGLYLIIKSFL